MWHLVPTFPLAPTRKKRVQCRNPILSSSVCASPGDASSGPLDAWGWAERLTTVEGQFITPTIIGHRLTLNPFLVFLSIAFWAWMWGPLGAFLAVPLLISVVVAYKHLASYPKVRAP